jgi:4-hydroxybenzoate polyprenyltransferase
MAVLIAGAVSIEAFATLALYYAVTLSYSFYVKRKLVMDVMTLAALYTIRIVAGGAATSVPVSEWLLAFSIFLFVSLAVVKRCDELASRKDETPSDGDNRVAGRGYIAADLGTMAAIGAAAGFCAVLVLALYINSEQVMSLYSRPHLLWACCFVLMYWMARMILLGQRGDIHDDPVVFAATDKASLAAFAIIAATVALAA